MFAQAFNDLHLLVNRQAYDSHLDHASNSCLVHCNETLVIHVCEEAHDELAIHAIGHPAMSRYRIAEIFDVEGALQAAGKETTKWSNERGKRSQGEDMELYWCDGDLAREWQVQIDWQCRKRVCVRNEDRVWIAVQSCENVCAKILYALLDCAASI